MTARSRVLVDPAAIEVEHRRLGGLPVINAVLERLGVEELLGAYLPAPDPRVELDPARVIGVLVRNLAVGREPSLRARRLGGGIRAAPGWLRCRGGDAVERRPGGSGAG